MKRILKKLAGYFFQGLLFLAPIAIVIYGIIALFRFIDNLLPFEFPGLGLLVILVGVTLVGFLTKVVITQPIYSIFVKMIDRAPLLKIVYTSIKDLLSAFVGKEKKFNHAVMVKVGEGMHRIGFLTSNNLKFIGLGEQKIAVYFPSSYGVLGELVIVDSDLVSPIEGHAAEIMKFIISGGISGF